MAIGDKYDVYISHNNEDRLWVTALAENLKLCGLSVWLDLLEPSTGPVTPAQRQEALGTSRRGVLLATSQSMNSAWLYEQYEDMQARLQADSDFRFVPVFFGSTAKNPWIVSPYSVDFSRPEPTAYRAAFRRLLGVLRKQASGTPPDLPSDLEIPKAHFPHLDEMTVRQMTQGEEDCLEAVFGTLAGNRPVMLLAPMGHDQTPIQRAILAEARRRYKTSGGIIHLVAHGHAEASKGEYFSFLCEQIARGRGLNKPSDFESLLEAMLSRGKSVFLLITGIEEGSAEGRRALSHSLRNLNERYHDWLRLVLCGGEHLLEMRYKEGNLSPLRKAEPVVLPEPVVGDIQRWQGNSKSAGLTAEEACTLLELTGGLARMIQQALRSRETFTPLDEKTLKQRLRQDAVIRACFAAYLASGDAERVAHLLRREDLGHYEIWPIQALLRHLYWDGLLAEREGRFRWRCDLVREIGREVMEE